ncbi:hypothetical protein [Paraburkholderia youngii]|uniref:hypothetical protein n=1 Tax=Paraburkholderia youngii TaxID=2782701 RepID=UPI003D1F54E3
MTTLATLFPQHVNGSTHGVTAVTHQDLVVALSSLLKNQKVAVLHMLYPRTDARTHSSLEALVDKMHGHGMHEAARLIAQEAHYLIFEDPAAARRAVHEIRNDSLAVGVHLYYAGLVGEHAEAALANDAQSTTESAAHA